MTTNTAVGFESKSEGEKCSSVKDWANFTKVERVCYYCKLPGHIVSNCPKKAEDLAKMTCYHCFKSGHGKRNCPHLDKIFCKKCKAEGHKFWEISCPMLKESKKSKYKSPSKDSPNGVESKFKSPSKDSPNGVESKPVFDSSVRVELNMAKNKSNIDAYNLLDKNNLTSQINHFEFSKSTDNFSRINSINVSSRNKNLNKRTREQSTLDCDQGGSDSKKADTDIVMENDNLNGNVYESGDENDVGDGDSSTY